MEVNDAKDKIILEQAQQIAELESQLTEIKLQLKAAHEKIAALTKNSRNSSKPPSSDIVKPKPPAKKDEHGNDIKRKIGAQPGHKQNLRTPISPKMIDEIIKLDLSECPKCRHQLDLVKGEAKKTQHITLVEKPVFTTEYQQLKYWCAHCQEYHYAALPDAVRKTGLFGIDMTALTVWLKGRGHMSYRTLQEYFREVMGIDISTGFLNKQIKKTSAALKSPYEELEELLQQEEHLNIDETSLKENGKLQWAWCFVAAFFTFFKTDASRGSQVLFDTLGDDFQGTIGSDFFSAYRKYGGKTGVLFQFCWAHLIREIKFLATLSDTQKYGNRLLKHVKKMFETLHRQNEMTEWEFEQMMKRHKKAIMRLVRREVPDHKKAAALQKRFDEYGESYFLFLDKPWIEPTNNAAEREIRTLVIDRMITQGVRSESGNEWLERFWTVLATCKKLGLNVMDFLRQSIRHFILGGREPPSFLRAIAQQHFLASEG